MRICLDIQSAIARRSGVGRYTHQLLAHLPAALRPGEELSLFYFDFSRKGSPFPVPGASQRAVRWVPGRVVQKAWKTIGWPPFNWFSGPADIFHFPNFIRPPLSRGRSVVTIHDVSFLRHPETLEEKNLAFLTRCIRGTVEKADAVITDCTAIAEEILEFMPAAKGKLHPIPLGIPDDWQAATPAAVEAFRRRHSLNRPYLLHVGTLEPRKNHAFLLDVFDRLEQFDGDLVLVGMKGWKFEPILERIARSPRRDRIRHLDFLDDAELPALYTGASLFLFPSLYEGFGFPPLEAMRCDVPVISSPGGSLREVVSSGAEVLELDDPARWVERTEVLLRDTALRRERIAAGRVCADRFRWAETAARTASVYRSLAS